jgi:hypothetical protein
MEFLTHRIAILFVICLSMYARSYLHGRHLPSCKTTSQPMDLLLELRSQTVGDTVHEVDALEL